jgi:hypothetical protein
VAVSSRNSVVLFSSSPEDLGWEDNFSMIPGLQQEVTLLQNAIVADIAERVLEQSGYGVIIFETSDALVECSPPLATRVDRRKQPPGLLFKRIQDGMREVLESGEAGTVLAFLGRNPLYPVSMMTRGFELLAQEDDVVVLGESSGEGHKPLLMYIALRTYHPEIFEHNERWWQGGQPLLQAAADVPALVMTLRPIRDITSRDDLGYLFHEIEREVLLKQWYPMRTYEMLHRMQRKHLIPETTG